MKIFGDDGFRSRFGQDYMTIEFISAFSNGLVDFFTEHNLKKNIIIGRDTRRTGELIHIDARLSPEQKATLKEALPRLVIDKETAITSKCIIKSHRNHT